MYIKPFLVEKWMNAYETAAKYNIAETCVDSISLDSLLELTGTDKREFLDGLSGRRLTYGDIEGAPAFREGVCRLYKSISPENVIPTHGAAGANHHVFYSLVSPGDRVISVMPTYQQLYSIPESFGADVKILRLTKENGYLPDLDELRQLAISGTKLICINNPNNPTGALMDRKTLLDIAEIAASVGAYVLCDEVYRHLTQTDGYCESMADLYDKGISIGSMSKVFSLAGLRLGWIATRDEELIKACISHKDYNHISCGIFDEAIASVALSHSDVLLKRSRGIVRGNLAVLDGWMQTQPSLSFCKPQAGTTALIRYNADLSSYDFCRRMLEDTGAFVTPGDCFEEAHSFRMGYACDRQTLEDGLKAVEAFLASL